MCRTPDDVKFFGRAKLGDPTAGMTDSEQAAYWRASRDRMAAQNMELGAENDRLQRERDYAVRWANKAVDDVKAAIDPLTKALEAMTAKYVELVNSGDCGFWDAEKVPEVIASRAALSLSRSDS